MVFVKYYVSALFKWKVKKHVKDPLKSGKRASQIPNQPSLTTVFFRLPTEKTSYEKMIEKIKIKRIKNK